MSINLMSDEYEYIIWGEVIDIDIKYPTHIQFLMQKVDKYKNKRKSRRYYVNLTATAKIQGYDNELYSVVKNISAYGVSIVLKQIINQGELVNIGINLSEKKVISLIGRVVRTENYKSRFVEYGVEIIQIDGGSKGYLTKLIDDLERNEAMFVSENLK